MFDANSIIGNRIECPDCRRTVKYADGDKRWRCACGRTGNVPDLYEFGRMKRLATSFRKSDPQKAISILVTLNEMKRQCGFLNYVIVDDELQIMLLLQQTGKNNEACQKLSDLLGAQIRDDVDCCYGRYFHRTMYFHAVYDKARLFCERAAEYRHAVSYAACAILCDLLNQRQTGSESYKSASNGHPVALGWEDVRSPQRSGLTRNLKRHKAEDKLPLVLETIFQEFDNSESPEAAGRLFQKVFELIV